VSFIARDMAVAGGKEKIEALNRCSPDYYWLWITFDLSLSDVLLTVFVTDRRAVTQEQNMHAVMKKCSIMTGPAIGTTWRPQAMSIV
jgi:hypothetical protein